MYFTEYYGNLIIGFILPTVHCISRTIIYAAYVAVHCMNNVAVLGVYTGLYIRNHLARDSLSK